MLKNVYEKPILFFIFISSLSLVNLTQYLFSESKSLSDFQHFSFFFPFSLFFWGFSVLTFFWGGGGKDRRRPVTYINHIPQERSQELFQPLFNQVCWLTASRLWGHLQWVKLGQTQNPQTTRGYPPLSHMLGLWAAGGSGHKGTPAAA